MGLRFGRSMFQIQHIIHSNATSEVAKTVLNKH